MYNIKVTIIDGVNPQRDCWGEMLSSVVWVRDRAVKRKPRKKVSELSFNKEAWTDGRKMVQSDFYNAFIIQDGVGMAQ